MDSLAPIAVLVITQMARSNGSVASLHYCAMRARGRFVELRGEYRTCLASLAGSLLVPAYDSLLVPLATTARPTAAVELASSYTDEKPS